MSTISIADKRFCLHIYNAVEIPGLILICILGLVPDCHIVNASIHSLICIIRILLDDKCSFNALPRNAVKFKLYPSE